VKRLIVVLVGIALLAAACAPAQSGSLGPAPTTSPEATTTPGQPTAPESTPASPNPHATTPAATTTVQIWFTRSGKLFATRRTEPRTVATSKLALTKLVDGPTVAEVAAGVGNAIAPGSAFIIEGISRGVETIDFPAAFYQGGPDVTRLRQAQVVYTLTQFPTVSRVGFRNSGTPTGAPAGRADYADLLPAIIVTSPVIGELVTSPVTITGTANVFEATVSIGIIDARGVEIANTFTTATCGTGCRGAYTASVGYELDSPQRGTVQMYEVSAKDGSRVNVVNIPVLLAPTR
jgi:Immunoglobulin-like domain of bacterial spore germination/Sporulation and spore germination